AGGAERFDVKIAHVVPVATGVAAAVPGVDAVRQDVAGRDVDRPDRQLARAAVARTVEGFDLYMPQQRLPAAVAQHDGNTDPVRIGFRTTGIVDGDALHAE